MELASAGPRGGGSPSLSPGEGQGVDAATSSLARLTLVCAGNALCQLSDRTYLFGQVVIEPQLCHDARGAGWHSLGGEKLDSKGVQPAARPH